MGVMTIISEESSFSLSDLTFNNIVFLKHSFAFGYFLNQIINVVL